MQGKRTSSDDKAKVIEAKINNPDLSTRDIEKKTWIKHNTASRILNKDLKQVWTQTDTIAKLIDTNNNILNLTWDLVLEKLHKWESVNIQDIMRARDLAFKQNALVWLSKDENRPVTVTFSM